MDRTLSNQFLIIINFFEYVGGFVSSKILGNTFPHPHKIFNQQKPKENLKEKKQHDTVFGINLQMFSWVCAKESKEEIVTAYLPEELSQTFLMDYY